MTRTREQPGGDFLDFVLAVVNAIGDISKQKAGDAIEREWKLREDALATGEADLFKRLSDALTGGNAGTWDEVFHAADALATRVTALKTQLAELRRYATIQRE